MAKKKLTEKDSKAMNAAQFRPKSDLPTLWVDGLHVALRGDDVCVLRFLTLLEEGNVEQARVVTNMASLKRFIEVMNSAIKMQPAAVKAMDKEKNTEKSAINKPTDKQE